MTKSKKIILSIVGILLPFVGIVLYFAWNKKDKKQSNYVLKFSIVGFIVYLFGLLAIFGETNSSNIKTNFDEWYSDVTSGKQTLTIVGRKSCPHCQNYKPVITSLANKHKFTAYFFELEDLTEQQQDSLFNTYELLDFDDHIPFTFIINNNKYVSGIVGFSNEQEITEYLKTNNIIEN